MNKTELLGFEDRVAALETRIPKKGYISVPPAAFVPVDSNWRVLTTNYLANYEAFIVTCVGSVQLPQGATVTNITVYWRDIGTQAVMTRLRRLIIANTTTIWMWASQHLLPTLTINTTTQLLNTNTQYDPSNNILSFYAHASCSLLFLRFQRFIESFVYFFHIHIQWQEFTTNCSQCFSRNLSMVN